MRAIVTLVRKRKGGELWLLTLFLVLLCLLGLIRALPQAQQESARREARESFRLHSQETEAEKVCAEQELKVLLRLMYPPFQPVLGGATQVQPPIPHRELSAYASNDKWGDSEDELVALAQRRGRTSDV